MYSIINFTLVIERPLEIVQKALIEGLLVHKNLNNIFDFKQSKERSAYYAKIDEKLWSVDVTDVSIYIVLRNTGQKGTCTLLDSNLRYTYRKKKSLGNLLRKFLFKQYMTKANEIRLHQFKHRIEKWL